MNGAAVRIAAVPLRRLRCTISCCALSPRGTSALAPLVAALTDTQLRAAAQLREQLEFADIDAVLEQVAPAITFTQPIEHSTVLVPDAAARPMTVLSDYGETFAVVYPAPLDDADPEEPSQRLMSMAKALADAQRQRALRELHRGPMTVSQLAVALGVPRTSLQYHVRLLMRAGLVALEVDNGRAGRLELRHAR